MIAAQEKNTAPKAQPAKLPTRRLRSRDYTRKICGCGSGQGRGTGSYGRNLWQATDYTMEDTEESADCYGPGGKEERYGSNRPSRSHGRGGHLQYSSGRRGRCQSSKREYERHSGTGRGKELKRQGSGLANWGTHFDDIIAHDDDNNDIGEAQDTKREEKQSDEITMEDYEKLLVELAEALKKQKEREVERELESMKLLSVDENANRETKMTLEVHERDLEERRKPLLGMMSEERNVEANQESESMKLLRMNENTDRETKAFH